MGHCQQPFHIAFRHEGHHIAALGTLEVEFVVAQVTASGTVVGRAIGAEKRAASVIIPARASEPPMNTADERRLLVIEAP